MVRLILSVEVKRALTLMRNYMNTGHLYFGHTARPVFPKALLVPAKALNLGYKGVTCYLINQTPGEKLRHGVALRASVTLVKSCELLSQLDYFTLVL